MNNKQFIENIEAAILELEHEDVMLFKKEEFLTSMICKSEVYNGRAFANKLCDNMLNEDDVFMTLNKKLGSIQNQRIQLLAQMDLFDELKNEAYQILEYEGSAVEVGTFFQGLFE